MDNSKQPINPYSDIDNDYFKGEIQFGLTKREYFAGLAMQGLLTRVPNRHNLETYLGIIEGARIAQESVIMADNLLKELENEETK